MPESQDELEKLMRDQAAGKAPRFWPDGRLSGDDDGALAMAIALDLTKRVILIKFSYPSGWIGLDKASAVHMRDKLSEYIAQLP